MSVLKVIELVGSSTKSIEDAAALALARASLTVRGIQSMEVNRITADIENDKIKEWHVLIRVSFTVIDSLHE